MRGIPRKPADAAMRVKDFLKVQLVGRHTVEVGLVLEKDWSPKTFKPNVVVESDGGPSEWPILTKPLIRVTVWSATQSLSREIAADCIALVTSLPVPGVADVDDPSDILIARDDNGGIMASFTVAAKSRTVVA